MFGSVWECLGISRAAVVRFAERTGGVRHQLYPAELAEQLTEQPDEPAAFSAGCNAGFRAGVVHDNSSLYSFDPRGVGGRCT